VLSAGSATGERAMHDARVRAATPVAPVAPIKAQP
jgi:hypothetical protein